MGLEVKKQDKESSQGLIRRFTKKLQQSGILFRVRKTRYKNRPKSRQMKKRAALRREETKKEYEKLSKLGKTKARR